MSTADGVGQDNARLLPRVPIVAGFVALVSLGVTLGVRALALGPFDVSSDTPALGFPLIVIGSVMPVFGNALGFFLSYRRPGRWSLLAFLGPAALFLVGGSVPVLLHWSDGGDGGALAAGLAVTAVPVALVVPVLLAFGRPPRAHAGPWPQPPAAVAGAGAPPRVAPAAAPPAAQPAGATARIDPHELARALEAAAGATPAPPAGNGTVRLTPEQLDEARRRAREQRQR